MADTSAKWGIVEPVAARTDAADVPLYVRNIVAALEAKGVQYGQGTLASRPAAAIQGKLYVATDQTPPAVFFDTGSAWIQIGALAPDSITAAQIAPDSIGTSELAPNSVTTAEIVDGTIATGDLGDDSVTLPKVNAALKPSTGAGGGAEALRALGTGAGQAAAGSHHTQHEAGGADQIVISQSMLDAVTAGLLPQPGDIKWVAYNVVAGSEPAGWLLCDGRVNLSTTTYAALFAKLNYAHGGSGAQFGIPDMRGRSPIGIGQGTYLGATLRTIGQKGGEESHQMSLGELVSHVHSISDPGHGHSASASTSIVGVGDHNHGSPIAGGISNNLVVAGATGDNSTTYTTDRWGTAGNIVRTVSGTSAAGGHSHSASTSVSVNGNSTGISIVSAGSSNPFNVMHPWIALTPLIKT